MNINSDMHNVVAAIVVYAKRDMQRQFYPLRGKAILDKIINAGNHQRHTHTFRNDIIDIIGYKYIKDEIAEKISDSINKGELIRNDNYDNGLEGLYQQDLVVLCLNVSPNEATKQYFLVSFIISEELCINVFTDDGKQIKLDYVNKQLNRESKLNQNGAKDIDIDGKSPQDAIKYFGSDITTYGTNFWNNIYK